MDDVVPEALTPGISNPIETLRFLSDQVPALFAYAGTARDGREGAPARGAGLEHLIHVRAVPLPYGTGWESLVETLDQALRLRRHQPGSLVRLAPVLHERTGGWAGALVHLVRSASIDAILSGCEEITDRDFDAITV
ncbi:hypothetical protein AB0D74_43195 [Streptomyces sp. NPDC048278]|uniref:hypothetical protein n=1 Tax=Streptomyces sp. NPDC048278 TaxID=3155809 RepID=UPI003418C88E